MYRGFKLGLLESARYGVDTKRIHILHSQAIIEINNAYCLQQIHNQLARTGASGA